MNTHDFDRVLDACLDRIASGDTITHCVADYPEHAERLEPLLRVALKSRDAYDFTPSPESVARARARLRVGIAERRTRQPVRRRSSFFDRLTSSPLPLAAIASVAVIALVVMLVAVPLSPFAPSPSATVPPQETEGTLPPPDSTVNPPDTGTSPTEPSESATPPPVADMIAATSNEFGNFVFYVSDAPNDIGDFQSLTVTIESIELKPQGSGPWISITPADAEADLVQLQGDLAVELWRGDVPEGEYSAAFVRISDIEGILASSGEAASVDLPSDRLHINADFSVVDGSATDFVFDITVHSTGTSGGASRYVLQPVASESGAGRSVKVVNASGPADDAPGKSGASNDSPHGGGGGHNGDETPPVTPPQPGPGPSSTRPRGSRNVSLSA